MSLRLRVLLTILVVNLVVCGVLSVFLFGEDAKLEALKREVHREKHFRRVLEKLCLFISAEWRDPHDYEAFRRLVADILEWEDWHKHFHDVVLADLSRDPLGEGFQLPGRILFNPLGAVRRGRDLELDRVLAGMERSIVGGVAVQVGNGWCEGIRVFQSLRPVGAIYYEARIPPMEHRDVTFPLAIVGGFTLLLMLLLYLALSRSVVGPLEELARKVAALAGGGKGLPLELDRGTPEIRSLARTFAWTMGRINSFREELEREVARATEEVRKKERQLVLSSRLAAMGTLAAGIAHEINNPLTGLLTFEHLLKDEQGLSPKGREYLDIMYKETSRMREIVMGLLNFSRESSTEMKLLDVNELIRQWLTLLRSQKDFDDITIEQKLADELPGVRADANQLQQVLVNLSLNACEAMPDGGVLTITTRKEADSVLVSIADTGCGIKAEHLEMIFDPFFTTKPVGKGTGLGLSVSYGIIRQHDGSMQVKSQEGQGTTFTFTLPAAKEG